MEIDLVLSIDTVFDVLSAWMVSRTGDKFHRQLGAYLCFNQKADTSF